MTFFFKSVSQLFVLQISDPWLPEITYTIGRIIVYEYIKKQQQKKKKKKKKKNINNKFSMNRK